MVAKNQHKNMPVWRNGRRTGLKIPRWQHRVGSTPTTGTKKMPIRLKLIGFFLYKSFIFSFKTFRSHNSTLFELANSFALLVKKLLEMTIHLSAL